MKINSLLESQTPSSAISNTTSSAPVFGRDDEHLDETTTSGSVATVASPVGGMQRRGKGSMLKGIKTSAKFPNSQAVKEGQLDEVNPHNYDSDEDYYNALKAPAKPRYRGTQSPGVNPDDEAYFREIFRKKRLAQQKAERDADHDRLATGTNEGEEMSTFAALKDWRVWDVRVFNNYYRGKYADYGPRLYSVVASSPEEARQVVINNADYVLQDLLSRKLQNGKKVLPRGSALPIEEKRVGKADPGTISTMAFKKMLTPDGVQSFKFTNGKIVDGAHVKGGEEQGVAEDQLDEKSKSQAQFRTMAAVAHNPEFAKKVGISQKVGKEFHKADKKQDYKDLPKEVEETRAGNRMSDMSVGSPKIVHKNGRAVGEIGLDHDPSPGQGPYYMKHYETNTWYSGYDTKQEALADLKHVVSQMNEEKQRLDPKCWTGYKKQGTKMKGGVRVNNCVKVDEAEVSEDKLANDLYKDLQIFKKGADKDIGAKAKDKEISSKAKDKDIVKKTVKEGSEMKINDIITESSKPGLWANIHAKRERIKKGSGERMRKPGSKGAPSAQDFKDASKTDEAANPAQQAAIAIAMKKKGQKPQNENAEYDDEAGMADNNLATLERAVQGIDELIQSGDNLPEWCQEKIAVAKATLVNVWDYMKSEEEIQMAESQFDMIEEMVESWAQKHNVDSDVIWEDLESIDDDGLLSLSEDWQKANKKDNTSGMSRKAVKAYRRENPGSKLQTAVTTKPSKLKKGSKASKRRKSFCARSNGQRKMHNIDCSKTPDKAICKARKRWNC